MVSLVRVGSYIEQFREAVQVAPVSKSVNGRVYIKIIEPGQGATGFYTPEVLTQAGEAGVFDNAPIMWNHPGKDLRSEQGPDATKLAGFIEPGSAQYLDKGPRGPALYGNATILKKNREEVASWVDTPFGLSIHASGELERPGDITSKVTRIDKVHSVDLVVKPGAGGAIVEVLESELLSVPTWNSHPLEPGYILSPLQESEDMLVEVGLSGLGARAARRSGTALRATGRGIRKRPVSAGLGATAFASEVGFLTALGREQKKKNRKESASMLIRVPGSLEEAGVRSITRIKSAKPHSLTQRRRDQVGRPSPKKASGPRTKAPKYELPFGESEPMLNLKYQLYEDDSSGNQYLYLGNESEQGFEEAAAERWSAAMGEDMKESDEDPQIFKDPQGNHFALVGGADMEEATTMSMVKGGADASGRKPPGAQWNKAHGPSLSQANLRTRGGVAGRRGVAGLMGKLGRNKGKVAIGAGIAGAGALAGAAAGRKRKESEEEYVEGEVYEQDGQYFQFLGDASALKEMDMEDDDEKEKKDDMKGDKKESSEVMEALNSLRAEIAEMREGPQKAQEVAEAANEATAGSYGTRRLIEQAAVAWAGNAEEATVIGKTIGQIVEAEREALAKEFGFGGRSHSRWQGEQPRQGNPASGQQQLQETQPYVGGAGAYAAGGGNLQETSLEKFDSQLDKLLEGVM